MRSVPQKHLLTLQNDLFKGLSLKPVPSPQLVQDVPLPCGEARCPEARRHLLGDGLALSP